MANENVRIQVREDSADHDWIDVGHKTGDQHVPVAIKSGAVSSTQANANNTYGEVLGIADAATGTIVNIASSPANFKLRGFVATGTGQGYFFLEIAGSKKYSYRTIITDKTARVILPNPEAITTGTVLNLKVTNENGGTADFEGVILGE